MCLNLNYAAVILLSVGTTRCWEPWGKWGDCECLLDFNNIHASHGHTELAHQHSRHVFGQRSISWNTKRYSMQHIELGKYVNLHYFCSVIYHWLMKLQQTLIKSWQSVAVSALLLFSASFACLWWAKMAGCVLFFTSCLILQLMMNGPDALVCLILLAVPDNMPSWTTGIAWSARDEG